MLEVTDRRSWKSYPWWRTTDPARFPAHSVKQECAKARMDASVLCMACSRPGPLKSCTGVLMTAPSSPVNVKLRMARAGHADFAGLVHIAICVAGDGDGLFPGAHRRLDVCRQNRRAEHRAIQNGTNGGVRALPHFLETVFLHALRVGRDRGALDRHAQPQRGAAPPRRSPGRPSRRGVCRPRS